MTDPVYQDSLLFREERRAEIMKMIAKEGKILVRDLRTQFGVSDVTIRQDLNEMEKAGLLVRTYGGAIEKTRSTIDSPFDERVTKRLPQKIVIAKAAMQLIAEGDSIILDGGSTVLELTRFIQCNTDIHVSVVVNFIPHLIYLENSKNINLIVPGGSYDNSIKCLLGPMTISALDTLYVDKAFISTTGLSIEQGITCTSLLEAEVRKKMLSKARTKILLADSSKIGKNSFVSAGTLQQIDILVTDWEISESDYNYLTNFGINVVIAEKPEF